MACKHYGPTSPDFKPELTDAAKQLPDHLIRKKPAPPISVHFTPVKKYKKKKYNPIVAPPPPRIRPVPHDLSKVETLNLLEEDKKVLLKYSMDQEMKEAVPPPPELRRTRAYSDCTKYNPFGVIDLTAEDIKGLLDDVSDVFTNDEVEQLTAAMDTVEVVDIGDSDVVMIIGTKKPGQVMVKEEQD